MDAYLAVKWIHILSSTILFGTGLGTALQMVLAHRSRNVQAIAVVARNVVNADWLCTLPSGIVQPISGAILIHLAGFDPWALWLVGTYMLYAIAGTCWIIVVVLQLRMAGMAQDAVRRKDELPPSYFGMFRLWCRLGWPAFLALVGVFGLMVFKPDM